MPDNGYACVATDFAGLRNHWNALLATSRSNTIFLSYEWLESWWRHFRQPGDRLFLFTMNDTRGTPVAIAPLCLTRLRFGGLPLRCLRFVGDGSEDSDYLDLIVARGHEEGALQALLDHLLLSNEWDTLLLRGMPEGSPTLEVFPRVSQSRGLKVQRDLIPCSSVPLPDDWEAYLRTLQPRFRTKLRAGIRYLEQSVDAQVRVEMCQSIGELDEYLAALFALHQQRWVRVDQAGAFSSAARRAFYRDFAEAFLRQGWLRLYRLCIDGHIAAVQLGFEYNRRFFQLQEGFDPDQANLSVGITLRAWVMRDLIARRVEVYDFLGGFDEYRQYKERWGAQPTSSFELLLARPGLKTQVSLALPQLVEGAKSAARRVLPEPLLELRRRWLTSWRQRRLRRTGASLPRGLS